MRGAATVTMARIVPMWALLVSTTPGAAIGANFQGITMGGDKELGSGKDGERRNLPFAHGRSFATLDGYLAHLRQYAGPIGQPWWREVRPGVYQHVTTRVPAGPAEYRTRAELMRQFGFTR